MTVLYTAEVSCDACGRAVVGASSTKPYGIAREVLNEAKQDGWSRDTKSKYLDLCPDCLVSERRGELGRF